MSDRIAMHTIAFISFMIAIFSIEKTKEFLTKYVDFTGFTLSAITFIVAYLAFMILLPKTLWWVYEQSIR